LLAPGPGQWISAADLEQLESTYRLPIGFANLHWSSLAAKLRVIDTIAPDGRDRVKELEQWHCNFLHRPFGTWHYKSYFATLAKTEDTLRNRGVTRKKVQESLNLSPGPSFQVEAELQIKKACAPIYYADSRIRANLFRWKLTGVPARLSEGVVKNFSLLQHWCNPRVLVTYLRTLWNGWVTDRRMNVLAAQNRGCVLGCGWDDDAIEHYGLCAKFWEFVLAPRPNGLGVTTGRRCREAFFLLQGSMSEQDRVRMAVGMHALYMVVNHCRWQHVDGSFNCLRRFAEWSVALLRGHAPPKCFCLDVLCYSHNVLVPSSRLQAPPEAGVLWS
jgi:hypothetical protein